MPGERLLRRDRRLCSVLGRGEGDEEGVALSVDLDALVARERRAQNAAVLGEQRRVRVARSLQQARRAFDVGEEKSHRAGWKLFHRLGSKSRAFDLS